MACRAAFAGNLRVRAVLIVATEGEAALLRGLGAPVWVSGLGAVNAALMTADALRQGAHDLVVSAGIAGAFPASGLRAGDVAVASAHVYPALGAMDGERFLDLRALGFALLPGVFGTLPAWEGAPAFARRAARALSVRVACGPILTVETVTGSASGARALEERVPGALAEAMEGAGVAQAALRAGCPALEVRGVSNLVGPRDRAAWRIPEALASLRGALQVLLQS